MEVPPEPVPGARRDEPEEDPADSCGLPDEPSEPPEEARAASDEPPEEPARALTAVRLSGAASSAAPPAPRDAFLAPSGSLAARRGAIVVSSDLSVVCSEEASCAEPDESPGPLDELRSVSDAPSEPREERCGASEESWAASDEPPEEPEPASTAVCLSGAASLAASLTSSRARSRTPPEPPDEEAGAESDEDDERLPGSSEVGAARGRRRLSVGGVPAGLGHGGPGLCDDGTTGRGYRGQEQAGDQGGAPGGHSGGHEGSSSI
ncbi:hypothetical protein GCM10027612_03060 [Microbispora bryophytorum subsp. camponoti]